MSRKQAYILKWGVLGWGVTLAVLFAVAMTEGTDRPFLPWLLLSLVGFAVGGLFWGWAMWSFVGSRQRRG